MKALPEDLEQLEHVNARFVAEIERYAFHYRCDECVHVIPSSGLCSMEFPNALLHGPHRAIEPDGRLVFCKYFQLV